MFRVLRIFGVTRKNLFRDSFQTEASAKVYFCEIRESQVIYHLASKKIEVP